MSNYREVNIKGYQCLKCEKAYASKDLADMCCKQYHCSECGCETPKYVLTCTDCGNKRLFNRAEKITEKEYWEKYSNYMVYYEGLFYSDIEELELYLEEKEMEVPTYVELAEPFKEELDYYTIIENLEESSGIEDARVSKLGYKELEDFLINWNKVHGINGFRVTNSVVLLGK